MTLVWPLLLACISSFVLTGLLRRYALKRNLIDIPNRRSSHAVPTPRGGGVAIVLVFLIALTGMAAIDKVPLQLLIALTGGGGCVALVGFIDDHGHIPVRWRLMVHIAGVTWTLAWLGGLPQLPIFGNIWDLGWVGQGLAAFYLVWLLNLYNFMDGIDGIAAIEAVTVCLGGTLLYLLTSTISSEWVTPMILLVAVGGFMVWNFPIARIFMGDAGSGFIGLVLGAMSIHAAWFNPKLFWAWVILLGVFMVDATLTLVRRIIRGDPIYEAHRSHAYQYAARKYGSHKIVSVAVGIINLLWLLPVAILVGMGWLDGLLGVLLTYIPLTWLASHYAAGANEL